MERTTKLERSASLALAGAAAMSLMFLSGCAEAPSPVSSTAPAAATDPRVVQYPNGRYELRGQGTPAAPHYWVWAPAGGVIAPPPTVPGVPSAAVTAAGDRVRTFTEGRYELFGEGTGQAPYYWVWVPAGATAPAPPPLPRPQAK